MEFAVALPVVALLLSAAVAGVLVVDLQGRLQAAAVSAARAQGRGDATAAAATLGALAPGARIDVGRRGALVCVTVERRAPGPFAAITLTGRGCSPAEPP